MDTGSMPGRVPTTARYFYFHVDEGEAAKEFWKGLAHRCGVVIEGKEVEGAVKERVHGYEVTTIARASSEMARLAMSLHGKVIIVSGLFYTSGEGGLAEERLREVAGGEAAMGESLVLITGEGSGGEAARELGTIYDELETSAGTLYFLEERDGERRHVYLLSLSGTTEALEHLLALHFPIFDFAIHRLHTERDYFKNQRVWVMEEKADIDRTVGEILHRRMVGKTLNPENIEHLEREIDTLSSKYAILVNDAHLIKKAATLLEEDMEEVKGHLRTCSGDREGEYRVLEDSMELKRRLEADMVSLSYSIQNTKTAIDTVRANVDLLRSRETFLLQEEAISLQVAAGFVEFLIVFYYSLASWSYLLGHQRFEAVPVAIRFTSILVFSLSSVAFTHFLGKALKDKRRVNRGMALAGTAILITFLYIVSVSFLPWAGATPH